MDAVSTVIRIGSHRANAKLKRLGIEYTEVYENSFAKTGYFAIVANSDTPAVLAITGLTKVRDQNTDHYSKCLNL